MKGMKEKTIRVCDRMIEGCFYVLLVATAFSTSLVEIASTLMIIAWIAKTVISRDWQSINPMPVKLLGLLLLWTILSCFNSAYAKESFRGILKILQYALVFCAAASSLRGEDKIKRFLCVTVGGMILICVNGFIQYFSGEGLIRHRTLIPLDYLRRISSSFIHPNDFGVYLLVVTIILISFLFSKSYGSKGKLMFSGALMFSAISLFLTRSRGSWISFAASLLTLGSLKSKKVLALLLVLLMVVFMILPYSVQERIFDLTDLKSGTSWERVMLWKGTIEMIKVHPFLGFGVNTYSRNFPKYKPAEYPDVRYSHNCYLHMASEIGIVGALIFLIFLVTVLIYSLKGIFRLRPSRRKDLAVGLFSGLVGFALNCMVDTHLYSVNLAVLFYLLLGFCFALTYHVEKTD